MKSNLERLLFVLQDAEGTWNTDNADATDKELLRDVLTIRVDPFNLRHPC